MIFNKIINILLLSVFLTFPTKLKADNLNDLYGKCQKVLAEDNYKLLKQYSSKLLREADLRNDLEKLSASNLYLGLCNLFDGDGKTAEGYLKQSLEYSEKLNDDFLKASALSALGVYEIQVHMNPFMSQYYFLSSLDLMRSLGYEKAVNELYINLAQLSISQKDTTGLSYAHKAFIFGTYMKDEHTIANCAVQLAILYDLKGDISNSEKYFCIAEEASKNSNLNFLGNLYAMRSRQLLEKGDLAEAKKMAFKSIKELKNAYPFDLPEGYLQLSKVYFKQEALDSAIATLKIAERLSSNSPSAGYLPEIYDLYSRTFMKKGDYTRAVTYLDKSNKAYANLKQAENENLKNHRQIMSELSLKEKEAALDKLKINYLTSLSIVLGISILFIILFITAMFLFYKKKKQLYVNIVTRNQQLLQTERELSQLKEQKKEPSKDVGNNDSVKWNDEAAKEANDSDADNTSKNLRSLFDKIERIVMEERFYASRRFTREELMERVGTNHTYFSKAVQQYAGTNFASWINSLRIKDAIAKLTDMDQPDYPLKKIADDVGFGSIAAFYNAFKKETGISPSEYRKTYNNLIKRQL